MEPSACSGLWHQIKVIDQLQANMQEFRPLGLINKSLHWHVIGPGYQRYDYPVVSVLIPSPLKKGFTAKMVAAGFAFLLVCQVALYATVTSKKGKIKRQSDHKRSTIDLLVFKHVMCFMLLNAVTVLCQKEYSAACFSNDQCVAAHLSPMGSMCLL